MSDHSRKQIFWRQQPKDARTNEFIRRILDAAVKVLAEGGGRRFTTARTAKKAGISVGALYKYFPNKAAILLRLQQEEWLRANVSLAAILKETQRPPFERLRSAVHSLVHSEPEIAELRLALIDAVALYRNAPALQEVRASRDRIIYAFVGEVLPSAPKAVRGVISGLIAMMFKAIPQCYLEIPRSVDASEIYTDVIADMLWTYLQSHDNDGNRGHCIRTGWHSGKPGTVRDGKPENH